MIMTWLQNGIIVNHWALCIHIDQNYDEVAEQQDFIAFWDSTKEYGDTAEAQTAALWVNKLVVHTFQGIMPPSNKNQYSIPVQCVCLTHHMAAALREGELMHHVLITAKRND